MKLHPILILTLMVQALLAGTKTQTRRLIRPQLPINVEKAEFGNTNPIPGDADCPYERPGDILWVKEVFGTCKIDPQAVAHHYQADSIQPEATGYESHFNGWQPALFMPYEACRLFLKISSVRVERLNDISEQDAIVEGIAAMTVTTGDKTVRGYRNYGGSTLVSSQVHSYLTLWESLTGYDSWIRNPPVWVNEFKRVEQPDAGKA
jgi:hypothetical protein